MTEKASSPAEEIKQHTLVGTAVLDDYMNVYIDPTAFSMVCYSSGLFVVLPFIVWLR